jgi:hypothetical protein
MSQAHTIFRRCGAFFSGILIGLASITPVFAAALDEQLTPRNLILVSALVVLGIAIAVKVMQRRQGPGAPSEDPDLRWWLNP